MNFKLWRLLLAPQPVSGPAGYALAVLIESTAKGTVLLLFAFVLTRLMGRSSAGLRHFVWALAVGSMLLLPIFSPILPKWKLMPALLPQVADAVNWRPVRGNNNRRTALDGHPALERPADARSLPLRDLAGTQHGWAAWILLVWAVGVALVLARAIVGETRVRKLVAGSEPLAREDAGLVLNNLRSRLRIARQIRLCISSEVGMPFTWGVLRPFVILPPGASAWSRQQLKVVLAHELAHVIRCDYPAQIPAHLACACFWFHPLVWYAAWAMRRERERACDDIVVCLEHSAADYADFLLVLARALRRPAAAALTGIVDGQMSQLEARMKALLDSRLGHRPLSGRDALLAAVLALALFLPVAAIRGAAKKDTGSITGTVRDPSGAVIPGTSVSAVNLEAHDRVSTSTGEDGSFEFPGIPAGRYQLEAAKPGFAYKRSGEFGLGPSAKLQENIVMDLGAVSEEVIVRGRAPTTASTAPPRAPQRIRVGGSVQAAKLIKPAVPAYPPDAKSRGIEGTVILRAVIGTNGKMLALAPYNDADASLIQAALDAVRQWRYQPTLLNGAPVEVLTTVTVVFRLDQ